MEALAAVLKDQYQTWKIKPVDLQKVLEPIDPIYRMTQRLTPSLKKIVLPFDPEFACAPIQAQTLYNTALKRGLTHGFDLMLPALKKWIKNNGPEIEAVLQDYWERPDTDKPDLVVSLIPNFNGVIYRALGAVHPHIPYVTIMTDIVDTPPCFWMEDQDQTIVCGSQKAFDQAVKTGFYDQENIVNVSGMILKQDFYRPLSSYALTRESINLDPFKPTALIMFGGNGSMAAQDIVKRLSRLSPPMQFIVLCGRNKLLVEKLQGRKDCHAVGFVSNVADYMRLADFFIGKPGPGSISEALHMGCPVIVEDNTSTMPQERPNAVWVSDNGVGIVVKSFKRDAAQAAQQMLSNLPALKQNIVANLKENRAVFEIASLLPMVMSRVKKERKEKKEARLRDPQAKRERKSFRNLIKRRL